MARQKPRQRAVNTRRKKFRTSKNEFVPPRTLEEFFAMPERDQEFWSNVGQVVTEMRAGASRSKPRGSLALTHARYRR